MNVLQLVAEGFHRVADHLEHPPSNQPAGDVAGELRRIARQLEEGIAQDVEQATAPDPAVPPAKAEAPPAAAQPDPYAAGGVQ